MASKKEAPARKLPVEQLTEVAEFESVKAELAAFRAANPQFFEYLDPLLERYNDKLQAAVKATAEKQVSCGDFDLYQWVEGVDAEQLYQSLGYEGFMAVGGKITTQSVYTAEKMRVKSAIAAGKIPKDVADVSYKRSPRFHKPEPARLP